MVLGGILVLLLPLAFLPAFHEPFVASKLLAILVLGAPAYVALGLSFRREGDPLATWRRVFALFIPLLAIVSTLKESGVPYHLAPFFIIAVVPLMFMEVGAAYGREAKRRRQLVGLAAVSAVPVLIVGLMRRYVEGFLTSLPDRADVAIASTFGNSNELAEFAAPVGVLALFLAIKRGRTARLGWTLCLPPFALVLISDSRAGALAVVAGIVVFAVLTWSGLRKVRGPRVVAAIALVAILVAALAVSIVPQAAPIRSRATTVLQAGHPTNVVRLGLWEATLEMWWDAPLLGIGAGRFERELPPHRDLEEWRLSLFQSSVESPHQEPLWIAAEGGLIGLLFLGAALVLLIGPLARALRSEDPELRTFGCAAAGAFAAFGVTALVRSPLHHPCGVLIPACLIGALAATAPPGPRTRFTAAVCHALVALTLIGSVLMLRQDQLVGEARFAYGRANTARVEGATYRYQRELAASNEALKKLGSWGPWSPHHAYRASLIAHDLAALRYRLTRPDMERSLEQRGIPAATSWLPSYARAEQLLDRTLEEMKWHHLARIKRADVLQDRAKNLRAENPQGSEEADGLIDEAIQNLVEYIEGVPQAPRIRVVLARLEMNRNQVGAALYWLDAESALHDEMPELLRLARGKAALRIGCDAATFGRWIDYTTAPASPVEREDLRLAREAYTKKDLAVARRHALLHLSDDPRSSEALTIVHRVALDTKNPSIELRIQGDHAVARLKLLLAFEADFNQDAPMAATNVRLSRRKDPKLLDTIFLAARLAGRDRDDDAVIAALRDLLTAGVEKADLLRRCVEEGATFQPYLDRIRSL